MDVKIWYIGVLVILNIISSVGLILLIKEIIKGGFDGIFSILICHFFCGWIILKFFKTINSNQSKILPRSTEWIASTMGIMSIGFMNLSLGSNSVGFYQMTKLLCIPVIIIIQQIYFKIETARDIQLSLLIIIFGVGLAQVYDVSLNALGSFYGLCALLSTSIYQIWQGSLQKEYEINGQELMLALAPKQVILCCILAGLFESSKIISLIENSNYPYIQLNMILVSCIFAVGTNLTCFKLIGNTSPITFQVVGHLKTVLILISGFMLNPPNEFATANQILKNIIGVLVALVGVFYYSYLKYQATFKMNSLQENTKDQKDQLLSQDGKVQC